MPLSTWNLPWLGHNAQRAYPLYEGASRTDQSGSFKIPDSLIVGLYLPINAGLAIQADKFYIRSISIFAIGLNVTIGYDDGSADGLIVASAVIAFDAHTEYRSYALPGADDFDDSLGKISIGSVDDLSSLPPGQYFFTPDSGRLDTDVVRPIIRGISSITLVNGSERGERIYGDVEFVAGSNFRLTAATVLGKQQIRFDAIEGEGLNDECICEGETETPCLKTINGIPPAANGNFTLLGSNCIELDQITNGLKFTDVCSDPCCGCTELEAITRDLEKFGEAAATLNGFLSRLDNQVSTMSLVVLGSRLGDRGCATEEEA